MESHRGCSGDVSPFTVTLHRPKCLESSTIALASPPPLVSKITNDCTKTHNTNLDIKFADRTTVIELMHHGDESAYRDEAC